MRIRLGSGSFVGVIVIALWLTLPASAIDNPEMMAAGVVELQAGDAVAAAKIFERLAEVEPDEPLVHYYLGVAAAEAGRDIQAARALSRAAELDPELPFVQADLGVALYRLGEVDAAETHLLEALLQGPDDAEVLRHLGLIDAGRGEYDRAIRLFGEAAELDPEWAARARLEAAHAEFDRGDESAAALQLRLAVASPGPESARTEAAELLALLEGSGPEPRRIALRGGFGIEYDDNVTVSEQDFTTGIGDAAVIFDAGIDLYAVRTLDTALYAGYDFYQSLYFDLVGFNLQSHSPYLVYEARIGRFLPRVGYRYSKESLGGQDFIDSHRIDVGLETQLTEAWYAAVGVRIERLDFADTPARDADRRSIPMATRVLLRDDLLSLNIGWEPEWQDARGPQFSYQAHILSGGATLLVPVGRRLIDLSASYDYNHRDYTNITPRIGEKRRDRRHVLAAGVVLPIASNLEALIDYLFISSSSNLPELNYTQNIISVRMAVWY